MTEAAADQVRRSNPGRARPDEQVLEERLPEEQAAEETKSPEDPPSGAAASRRGFGIVQH